MKLGFIKVDNFNTTLNTTREQTEIVKAQLQIMSKRIKNKPMDRQIQEYITQLQTLLQLKDKRISELLCENSQLILEVASLKIDLERIRNGYEEAPYK